MYPPNTYSADLTGQRSEVDGYTYNAYNICVARGRTFWSLPQAQWEGMGPDAQATLQHGSRSFAYLLGLHHPTYLNATEFARLIEQTYDMAEPRNAEVVRVLRTLA